ncbi:RICIN domain-containing protein [Amycolatopsis sp. lyj-23]|uniref:RICIN domain-containing protein n=1 Tax=Amycolatopsis sp. lyj-23 TaxID=2789283 RepID=UPI00397AAD6B
MGGPLTSANSGRCADSPGGTTVNGTQLVVWDCNGGENQKVAYSTSAKTLKVLNKCFDAHASGTVSGTQVELYDCNGGANQQWNTNSDGTITGVQSGLCLDVSGAVNPHGSGIQLWACNGGANQRWTLGAGTRVP